MFSLLQAIGRAEKHIHIDTYIIEDDPLGNLIADALTDKARQGVEVRLIYDDVGCWRVSDSFFERMRDAGIDVHAFMPVRFPAFTSKVNYRNHRKLCVVDGKVGFIGGMNMALRYVKGRGETVWRDTHLRIEGGGVYAIQRAFLVDWYFVDRTLGHRPSLLSTCRCGYPQQLSGSGGDEQSYQSPWPDIMQGYVRILLAGTALCIYRNPLFLAYRTCALCHANSGFGGRGCQTRWCLVIAMPRLVEWASRSYMMEAIEAGVKVYFYEAGFNHSKLLVSDDKICSCGSTNVDFRSFENNFEANAFFFEGHRRGLADQEHFSGR